MIRRLVRSVPFLTILVAAGVVLAPSVASAEPAVAVSGNRLVTFDTARPTVTTTRPISGIDTTTDTIVGIDVRPLTGVLYAVALRDGAGANDTEGWLYTIDPTSGVATIVNETPFSSTLADGTDGGIDFNPVTDQIRLVTAGGDNLRINPANGTLIYSDPATNGATQLIDIAHDRSAAGAAATTLFAVDPDANTLDMQGSPNGTPVSPDSGTTTPVGALGFDAGAVTSLDISSASGVAYLGIAQQLYTVNLATGAATPVGDVGVNLGNLTILPASTLQMASTTVAASEENSVAAITVTRLGSSTGTARIDYATSNGTAIAPVDYEADSGTLTFGPGVTSRTIYIPIGKDGNVEKTETFTVTLANATGAATLGAPAGTTVSVTDLAVPDTMGPFTLLAPLGLTASKTLYSHYVYGTYSCSEACTAVVALKIGSTTLGSAKGGKLKRAGAARGRIFLTWRGKALVRSKIAHSHTGRISVLETVTTMDVYGNKITRNKRIYVVR